MGQEVKTLYDGPESSGMHSVVWDGKDDLGHRVSSGIDIYQLTAEPISGSGERFKMR